MVSKEGPSIKNLINSIIRRLIWRSLAECFKWSLDQDARDIQREMRRQALVQTAEYVLMNMKTVPSFDDRWALMEMAIGETVIDGCFTEFGVWKGGSINFIAQRTDAQVHGFDSFEGLPEDWVLGYNREHFKVDGMPKVAQNVTLHKGWYEDVIPKFASVNDSKIAFSHIDCDLYSSTKTIFKTLGDRMLPGTIIVFDEYFNYPGWKEDGEFLAFQEYIKNSSVLDYEYIGYTRYAPCVAVKLIVAE